MIRIARQFTTCLFAPDQPPVAEVAPGQQIIFETQDAQAGRVKTMADALTVILPVAEANPVTGPLYVHGAQPGDTLAVHIVDIRVGEIGLCRVRAGRGVLGDQIHRAAAKLLPVRNGMVYFTEHISLAARPMIGTVGTAPAHAAVPSYCPGLHGGNLDLNVIGAGATVYLPVAVEGALLAMGDVHASMGDGELTGGGIDIPAEVTVQVEVYEGLGWRRPVVETDEQWYTCANAPTLDEAIRLAAWDMTALLSKKLGLTFEESLILIGAAGDVRIGQAAHVGIDMTVCLGIAKTILPAAF